MRIKKPEAAPKAKRFYVGSHVTKELKQRLVQRAAREHRSVSVLMEMLLEKGMQKP